MVVISCALCIEQGKEPFELEYTTEGAALMKAHLEDHEKDES